MEIKLTELQLKLYFKELQLKLQPLQKKNSRSLGRQNLYQIENNWVVISKRMEDPDPNVSIMCLIAFYVVIDNELRSPTKSLKIDYFLMKE